MSVFDQAYGMANDVASIVESQIQAANSRAQSALGSAQGSIGALDSFAETVVFDVAAPVPPELDDLRIGNINLSALGANSFGTVSGFVTSVPSLEAVPSAADIDISPFVPSITGLTIPEAPVFTAPDTAPERPATGEVTLPDAPVLERPLFPSLDAITIPAFTFPTLPTFDATAPEFVATSVSTVLQWADPQYETELMTEVAARIRTLWGGGMGLPAEIEQALWERAASREDLAIARDISAATNEFSARGFTAPQGMLAARIDAIREEGTIKKLALNRDIAIKAAEVQIENFKFAVTQAVAAESLLFNIWNNIAQRQFEAAKIELDSQLAYYNAQVALFNARQSAYATQGQIFETRLKGELARIEVFKAQLEGELARGTLNEQRVKIYGEQIRALLTDIEIYKAQMQGAQVQSDVIKTQIDGYRADVQAYAERINADKVRFDAYESRVKGESAKAGLLEAEARAYAAYVQGRATVADVGIKNMQAVIEKNRLTIQRYQAQLEADKTRMDAEAKAVQANASAHTANTQRYVAQMGAEEAKARLEIAAYEAEMKMLLTKYDAEVQRYRADLENLTQRANIQVEALRGAAQAGATLAAGAMSAVNVGANLSGSGSIGASGSAVESTSTSHNYSY